MKVACNLPIILDFCDYHDIDDLYYKIKRIIPNIKREEIDFANGRYYGIFYAEKDAKYKKLIKEHKEVADSYEEETWG